LVSRSARDSSNWVALGAGGWIRFVYLEDLKTTRYNGGAMRENGASRKAGGRRANRLPPAYYLTLQTGLVNSFCAG
jgi:hypothetical protein